MRILLAIALACTPIYAQTGDVALDALTGGKAQYATTLNGTSQYWTGGDIASLNFERTDAFSVLVVVRWNAVNTGTSFVAKANGPTVVGWGVNVIGTNARIGFVLRNTGTTNDLLVTTPTNSISVDNAWHLVGVTYAGTSVASGVRIYIDGDSLIQTIVANTLSATTQTSNHFAIGARVSGAASVFNGSVGQTVIVKKALTADEVKNAYVQWKSGRGLPKTYGDGQVVLYVDWKAQGLDRSNSGNHLTGVASPPTGKVKF